MEFSAFKASSNFGDLISLIPAMRKDCQITGKKAIIYLRKNVEAFYYDGATHPVMKGNKQVMINDHIFDMIRPLLLAQDFVEDVKEWRGEKVKLDFDILYEMNINKPNGSLNRWIFYIYPDLSTNLSNEWINVPDTGANLANDKIIITRSERYNNPLISYFFLKEIEDKLLFAGTKQEHDKFCKDFDLQIEFLKVDNFLILAQALKQCLFHISNQTGTFQISEGLKIPRILELCSAVPNVFIIGDKAFDFYFQVGLEYYVNLLNKNKI